MDTWQILKNTHDMRVGHVSDATRLHDRSVRAIYNYEFSIIISYRTFQFYLRYSIIVEFFVLSLLRTLVSYHLVFYSGIW